MAAPERMAEASAARTPDRFDAIVVGAGFAGMYGLHRLREMGLSVRVYERGGDVGGTWYWNRYPGARCDIESQEYSYSFSSDLQQDWNWSERYGTQPELLAYANHVADRFDLRRDIRFETRVAAAEYDDASRLWTVTTDTGETATAPIFILATGNLSTPQLPDIPGVGDFAGRRFHTGDWPREPVDFTGRRVGVIGTGSTAIQAIPAIAEEAKHLYVFQRTANFSVPAHHGPMTDDFRAAAKAAYDETRRLARTTPFGIARFPAPTRSTFDVSDEERQEIYEKAWAMGGQALLFSFNDLLISEAANETAAEFVRNKIRATVNDPEVAELLCPDDHPIGTKRLCLDSHYFETFNRKNVTLVDVRTTPITEITASAVVVGDRPYEIDDLVLATGFDAMTGAARDIDIRNGNGLGLRDAWADGPRTYLGLMVAGFPSLFMITGPQSPSVKSQMILSIEQHVDLIASIVGRMRDAGAKAVAATADAQKNWVDHANELAETTLYTKANSWYMGANTPGKPRMFMPYAGGVGRYKETCDRIVAEGFTGFVFEG
ncbi:MAG: cyclohexanone monooxygenase [Rhodospirillaceae bacterium]|nr:cyclohexanone monooxygenase [Rhodospirillaceae bacterium]